MRSTEGGVLSNPVPLETQVADLASSVDCITQVLQVLEARINGGEGTCQRRETGGQTGQQGGHNGGAYGRLTKVEFLKFDGEEVEVYQTHVKKRFEYVFEDPVVELKNLKQTTTVQVIEGAQREQGHRKVRAETAVIVLTERVAELERDNKRLRGTASVESHRVDRIQRNMARIQRELRQIRWFRCYNRVRVGRFEACTRKHMGYRP
ncbi:hypothetical protein Tco_1397961 [Tanacetum coccineum]